MVTQVNGKVDMLGVSHIQHMWHGQCNYKYTDLSFKCVRLHEHTEQNPQVHKLTKEMLEKVAQDIADPDAAPQCMFE